MSGVLRVRVRDAARARSWLLFDGVALAGRDKPGIFDGDFNGELREPGSLRSYKIYKNIFNTILKGRFF